MKLLLFLVSMRTSKREILLLLFSSCRQKMSVMFNDIYIYRLQWVNCLNYPKMKITLTFNFISYIYKNYMKIYEILRIKFIERNRHWLQPRSPNDFGISCKPFRWCPYSNQFMLPLPLPIFYLWYCTEFYVLLAQQIKIKGISIWRIRWVDVSSDAVI